MTTREVELKHSWMEAFDCVCALYYVLRSNSSALRTKQVMYRADEVTAEPLDFVIDVELKAKRLLGESLYNMFLRAVFSEQLGTLPEYTREALGRTFIDYGLTPEGSYRRLYYTTKNDQIRSYLKEQKNNGTGIFRANDEPIDGDLTFGC